MVREVKGTLLPCPSCFRHVRLGSTTCPFCAGVLPDAFRREGPTLVRRKTRFGAYSHTAATAAMFAAVGCGDVVQSVMDASVHSPSDDGTFDAVVVTDVASPQKDTGVTALDGSSVMDAGGAVDSGADTSSDVGAPCDSGPWHILDACGDVKCGFGSCSMFECRIECPPPPPYGAPAPFQGDE
jgi:hypothetical protein